jgi:hypothetical protein
LRIVSASSQSGPLFMAAQSTVGRAMTFITFKFLHVAFMFMGVALAAGPALLVYLVARSGEAAAIRRVFALAERIFQISTVCFVTVTRPSLS